MIYDCFLFYNEFELLEIRLHELNDVVDYFVLVEANKTHVLKDKELFFDKNKDKFSKFLDKIIHVVVREHPKNKALLDFRGTNHSVENYHRNFISKGLIGAKKNDIILISDVDEIPRKSIIEKINTIKMPCTFNLHLYYYYLNFALQGKYKNTPSTVAVKFGNMKLPQYYRNNRGKVKSWPIIDNAGWHFSYMGGFERIIKKLESYAHQEKNTKKYKNIDYLKSKLERGEDIFSRRNVKIKVVDIDETFPNYLFCNRSKFSHLVFKGKGF